MTLRFSLVIALAAAGCAKQAPQARAPRPMFDVSRICHDPHYGTICDEKQPPAAFPVTSPIRVDTNLATPPSVKLAVQG